MFKRFVTFLLGVGLIGLGIFFFATPEQAVVVQLLKRFWPLFLVLAGLVRLAGYLLDRQPRSPVGSLILMALGGILLAINLRGADSLAALIGRYWFWFLLAYVTGRVLRQYAHRAEHGKSPRALSPGAIFVMLLITTTGLSSNYLSNNDRLLSRVNWRIGQLGGVGDYVFGNPIKVDDEPAQSFKLPPNARLSVGNFAGDIEIRAGAAPQATAKLTKTIRAANEESARAAANNIHLQILPNGNFVQLGVTTDHPNDPFTASLLVEVPKSNVVNLEVNDFNGLVKISDLHGAHTLRNCARIKVSRNLGRLSIEGARGLIELSQQEGEVILSNLHGGAELSDIKGQVSLNGQGGNYRLSNLIGTLRVDDVRDARLNLANINGNGLINSTRTRIEAEAITGDWEVSVSAESVKLNRHKGNLHVTAENGSISVVDLQGGAQLEATRDIAVQNFTGPLNVKTRTGRLTLAHNTELSGDLIAVNEYGPTRLTLPADIAFRLDASTASGRLRARGFDGLTLTRNQRSLTTNYHADGDSPLVNLRSTSGNIELQSSGLALASNDDQ